jgi:16S rRNA (guanine(966)-N(2))-methyltransferase RsmD
MLDLFAGSGSVGVEAITRGVDHVVFVESDSKVLPILSGNCAFLNAQQTHIIQAKLPMTAEKLRQMLRNRRRFDLIFADPPYAFSNYDALLSGLLPLLVEAGELAVEHSSKLNLSQATRQSGAKVLRSPIYGDSQLTVMVYSKAPN